MDLNAMMEEERTRLQKLLEDIYQRRAALDQEEGSINTELSALTAYFDTKLGKVTTRQMGNAPKVKKTRGPRMGTSVKQQVLGVMAPTEITKQDILVALNATDNKSLQNGISNALVQLKKAGTIVSGERGTYKLPEAKQEPAEPKVKRVKKEEVPAS